MTNKPPPQIPNYRIVEKLGEGGMASVWLAQRDRDHRISVVKVLHDHLTSDVVVRSRFLREGQIASLLDHPNIAHLYDAGLAGAVSYLAMEFIPGQDVEAMMMKLSRQKKLLPPQLSITITLRLLEGLHYAHEFLDADGRHLEIVHRDLSPRNVMVTFDGEVKIIDFGLVRSNLGDFRTAPGMIAGTLRYMSPEQATAERVDRRSDLYTWAVVLYELLCGRPVVTASEARAILGAVVVDVPPPLSTRVEGLPRSLDSVLAKALEKDSEKRFQSALEFRDALALAAGPLGMASPASISEFVGELFPAEKIKASERLESAEQPVSEGPAFESTRLAESAEIPAPVPAMALERTVTDRPRPRPRPLPTRGRSRGLPWILSAAAFAICLAAFFASRVPPDEEMVAPSPPTAPRAQVTVSPSPIEEPPPTRPPQRSSPARPVKRPVQDSIGVVAKQPPISEEVGEPSTTELAARFLADAKRELGDARGQDLYNRCLAPTLALSADDPEEVSRKHSECRRQLASTPR